MKNQRFGILTILAAALFMFGVIVLTVRSHGALSADLRVALSLLVAVVEGMLFVWSLYQAVVAVAGFFSRKAADLPIKRWPRILCLTAAHNESSVIAEHIRSLQSLDYPANRYDIAILADNCTDRTARIAKKLGTLVWERHNPYERGKGHALHWALHSKVNLHKYDAVCIFDADNLADPGFLKGMARHLQRGHVAIQGYLDTKNPWDSWVTASYAGAYWFMNRFWQRARMTLGLSGALGGTGFCLATSVLRQVPWEATSLTEDLEYTVRLVLRGYQVQWTADARVYDEKPVRFAASVPQRSRWMQGHWMTAGRYSGALLRNVLSTSFKRGVRDGRTRRQSLDMLVYLWQPAFVLLMGLNVLFSLAQMCFGGAWFYPWLADAIPATMWMVLGIIGFSLPLAAFALERAGWRSLLYYPGYLWFNLTWVPVTIEALRHLHSTQWVHTEHHRALSLSEVARVRSLE